MKTSKRFLIAELAFIFVGIPCLLFYPVSYFFNFFIITISVIYILQVAIKQRLLIKHPRYRLPKSDYIKFMILRYISLMLFTTLLLYFFYTDKLFLIALKKPLFWFVVSLFYFVGSVYPQEFLYRTFFYGRYRKLFKNTKHAIIVNAILFSLAHIIFKNMLVLILTFIGGVIFSLTYLKTKSLLLTSIEHALYGCWLFAIGMGDMLDFPTPD